MRAIREKKEGSFNALILFLYIIFFTSLFFSFRAVSSISIAALLVTGLVNLKNSNRSVLSQRRIMVFVATCAVFFLLQLLSPLLNDQLLNWKDLLLKSGIVFIPLAVFLSARFSPATWKFLLQVYCLLLSVALAFCLIKAGIAYANDRDIKVFFYHELMKPLRQHAVYFSIFVFFAIIIVLEHARQGRLIFQRPVSWLFVTFFAICLLLLSSKLVLFIFLLSLVYYVIIFLKQKMQQKNIIIAIVLIILLIGSLVVTTRNPVGQRFREVFSGDPALVNRDSFEPGIYFTSVQLRLLQWKLVQDILKKQESWWTGVGAAKAQALLDDQYISRNMYVGEPARGDKGYLGFNTHNQFLESLLKNGIPGAIVFLVIILAFIQMGWKKRRTGYIFIFLLLLIYSLIESVFETQYGQVLFTFFPVLLLMDELDE